MQKTYKIKAKPAASKTEATTVCLNISMNNQNQTGEKLLAMVGWVNANFKTCMVNVSDSLQRHNLQSKGFSKQDAYQKSIEMGDLWLERNKNTLDQIHIPHSTIRWDQWLEIQNVKNLKATLYALYHSCELFQSCVDTDMKNWIARQEIKTSSKTYQNGLAFLLEEFAVHSYIAQKQWDISCQKMVQAYPAKQLYSENYLQKIHGRLGLEKSIFIRQKVELKNKKAE